MSLFELERFTRRLYEAAFDDVELQASMADLARHALGAAHGMEHNRTSAEDTALVTTSDVDPAVGMEVRRYGDEYNLGLRLLETAQPWRPFHFHSFVDFKTLDAAHPTRRFLEPHGFEKTLITRIRNTTGQISYLTVFRQAHDEEFSRDDEALATHLSKHVFLALRIRELRVADERRNRAWNVAESLGRSAHALMVLSPSLRPIDLTPAAERLLHAGGALGLRYGRLVSRSREAGQSTHDLEAFFRASSSGARTTYLRSPTSSEVLRLTAVPLGPDIVNPVSLITGGAVAVILEALPKSRPPDLRAVVLAFDLTDAEARVLSALLDAPNLTAAAAHLKISRNTAKAHLSAIFRKTNTETQSDLMLALSSFQ